MIGAAIPASLECFGRDCGLAKRDCSYRQVIGFAVHSVCENFGIEQERSFVSSIGDDR
jgi:hypothetical protein